MMRAIAQAAPPRPSHGFTLIEVLFVSGMMSLLALLISAAWSGLGRPSADAIARARVAHEANLAAESLARDFSASLPEEATGGKQLGRMVGRMAVEGSQLRICFDGGPANGAADWAAPDTVIAYEVLDQRLVRSNLKSGTAFTVAACVDRMVLAAEADAMRIELTFSYRDVTRTYTMIARDP
jgi:prepilin-type N-terminal cleavage/methylation domain-containing protein